MSVLADFVLEIMEYVKLYQIFAILTICVAFLKAQQCDLGKMKGKAVEEHELNKSLPKSVRVSIFNSFIKLNEIEPFNDRPLDLSIYFFQLK